MSNSSNNCELPAPTLNEFFQTSQQQLLNNNNNSSSNHNYTQQQPQIKQQPHTPAPSPLPTNQANDLHLTSQSNTSNETSNSLNLVSALTAAINATSTNKNQQQQQHQIRNENLLSTCLPAANNISILPTNINGIVNKQVNEANLNQVTSTTTVVAKTELTTKYSNNLSQGKFILNIARIQ